MTTTFQPGQHPDADQLNAFVEHALPPHEQQAMLAHLASCADCRAIAYLAQPPAPEPLAHPVSTRTNLFARWMLIWPTAAALACLVILTIHIHNVDVARNKAPAVNTAHLEQTPPPPTLEAAPESEPEVPPTPTPAQVQPPPQKPAPSIHIPAKTPAANPAAVPLNTFSRTLASPGAAGLPKLEMEAAANAPAEKKSASPTGFVAGAISLAGPQPAAAPPLPPPASPNASFHGAVPLRSAATQYDLSRAPAQQVAPPPAAPPPPAAGANSGIYGGSGPANLNAAYTAGVPASAATAPSSTVTTGTDAIAVDNASAEVIPSPFPAKPRPTLPSHLPALSVAISANHQLAIDTAGSLFRSDDAGVTWLPVAAQWTGRATKVVLLPSISARQFGQSLGALTAPRAAAKTSAPPQPTFQLTTDTGALWVSADGQTWKPK